MFSTVKTVLLCRRCSAPVEAEVQFYTNDDYRLPVYQIGDRVPLPVDTCYEGISRAYCDSCGIAHAGELRVVELLQLAIEVESGDTVVVREGRNLSPDEVRALEKAISQGKTQASLDACLTNLEVQVFRNNWRRDLEKTHQEMMDRGWSTGVYDTTEEIWIVVTSVGTIAVTLDPPPPPEEPIYPRYTSVSELLDDQGVALSALRGQKFKTVFEEWHAVSQTTRGWFLDGSVALQFERQILIVWLMEDELKLKLLGPDFFPNYRNDLESATLPWRPAPWTEFFPLYDQRLNEISFNHDRSGWSATIGLERVNLHLFPESGELCWKLS